MKPPQMNRMSRRNRGLVLIIGGTIFAIIGNAQLLFGTRSLLGGPGYAPLLFGVLFLVMGVIFLPRPKA